MCILSRGLEQTATSLVNKTGSNAKLSDYNPVTRDDMSCSLFPVCYYILDYAVDYTEKGKFRVDCVVQVYIDHSIIIITCSFHE